jgi:hypothetical protein
MSTKAVRVLRDRKRGFSQAADVRVGVCFAVYSTTKFSACVGIARVMS